ncbi:methyltransferase domain-containing protein [Cryobacterium melibiosiphilum]|uniref:Methyltransferase domain-containing protein n=1 Tax=Cryobacterium melibiosiphilum TaxID=995039 RepID=A0A3A5MVL3_9MICO|nr:methyltransferase domain-containing protein [Cryobacterium melibiosiphilum]RJT89234.1 methyltransferase domain-containing protein [Cryobacterium melibiosiphilum]
MSLQNLSEWLRCPNCVLPLTPSAALSIGCPAGHSFDVNKRGFVSLLSGPRKFIGDSAVMLDARDRFQGGGFYSPLREAIARIIAGERPSRIIDVGCGSGYYLRAVLEAVSASHPPDPPRALAMDLSPAAVARTVRSGTETDGLVADVWSALPIRDAAANVILNVFAPRNAAEFHRVLTPGGLLLVVVPQSSHLQELRAAGLAVSMQPDKARHLVDGLSGHFVLQSQQSLSAVLSLSAADVGAVLGMGPSAHHTDGEAVLTADAATSVTAAFDIFSFRRRAL